MAKASKAKPASPAAAKPAGGSGKQLLKVVCGGLARKVNLPQFTGAEWHHDTVDLTFLSGGPNLNLLKKKTGFDAALLPYSLQALTPADAAETLAMVRAALKPGGVANIMVFDLQRLGEYLATNRGEEPVLKSNLGDFTPIEMLYGPAKPDLRTAFQHCYNTLTLGRLLRQAGYGQIRIRRDQFNLLAAGVRAEEGTNLAAERIQVIDPAAPRGLADDLESPPVSWKPLGLHRR